VRVILEAPTWDHGLQVCGQRRHALAGDEFAKVEAMGAKIADDKGGAGLRRIGAPEPAFIEPMQCKAVTALPAGEKWTFEIKFDGYCCIVAKCGTEIMLFSRNEKVLNQALPEALTSLEGDFVLDCGNSLPWIRRGDLPSRRYGTTFRERFGKVPLVPPQRSSCC
jgi:hypothetical protein